MPIYEFICAKCSETTDEPVIFERLMSFSENMQGTCPHCGTVSTQRKMSAFAVDLNGRTRAEILAGTTKTRKDLGRYMKDQRDKRKREADPNSKDAISNEYHTGSEVKRGVYSGPSVKKS